MAFWIDTHCHWDAPEFDHDRDPLREAARTVGVAHCVIPAIGRMDWETVRELAHRWGDSYALGIHPLYTGSAHESDIDALAQMLEAHRDDPRLVAIGEIGLDFFVEGLDADRQTWFYQEQLKLARRFDLPVIVHVRKSSDQLLKALRQWPVMGGIAHAFNGSLQQAQQFIAPERKRRITNLQVIPWFIPSLYAGMGLQQPKPTQPQVQDVQSFVRANMAAVLAELSKTHVIVAKTECAWTTAFTSGRRR